jgi:hypothetical protein
MYMYICIYAYSVLRGVWSIYVYFQNDFKSQHMYTSMWNICAGHKQGLVQASEASVYVSQK